MPQVAMGDPKSWSIFGTKEAIAKIAHRPDVSDKYHLKIKLLSL